MAIIQLLYLFFRLILAIYLAFPIVFKLFPSILNTFVFLKFVRFPLSMLQLYDPKGKTWNLKGVTNYYLEKHKGVRLGIWHLAPTNGKTSESLAQAKKVILYCHGSTLHRAGWYRLELYNMLRQIGFHVVCFDYRGFADSSGLTTEAGVIQDAVDVYRWTVAQLKHDDCQVLVWGHSLGAPISTQMMIKVQAERMRKADGLVLEAPFTTLLEVMSDYPLSRFVIRLYPKWLFRHLLKNATEKNNLSFSTVKNLPKIKVDVMILHAKDDSRVPHRYSTKIFQGLKFRYSCRSCKFISFKETHGLGHNTIFSFSKMTDIVDEFSSNINKATCSGFSESIF